MPGEPPRGSLLRADLLRSWSPGSSGLGGEARRGEAPWTWTLNAEVCFASQSPSWDHSAAFAADLVSFFALATGKLKMGAALSLATTMKGFA